VNQEQGRNKCKKRVNRCARRINHRTAVKKTCLYVGLQKEGGSFASCTARKTDVWKCDGIHKRMMVGRGLWAAWSTEWFKYTLWDYEFISLYGWAEIAWKI
jgi:hypothetical protein